MNSSRANGFQAFLNLSNIIYFKYGQVQALKITNKFNKISEYIILPEFNEYVLDTIACFLKTNVRTHI